MVSNAQLKAQYKYDKANTQQVILKLNLKSDSDILEKLLNEDNKQGYIKALIRDDMRNKGDILSLDAIRYLLLPVVHKYEIKSVSIFGSYARNEAKPSSDVDIIVDGGNYTGLVEYMNMIKAMETALGRAVDVVTADSLLNSKAPADILFKERVEKERIELI